MSLFNYILKKSVPIPKILEYDSFAFIGAHPDDIECGCGATVAKLTNLGKKVIFIIVTDGQYGTLDSSLTKEKIIDIRKDESILAAKVLGVTDVRFLNFPDGGRYNIDKVADKLAINLVDINPDLVFTIDNHVKSETHPDHLQVGKASELAFFRCSFPLMMQDLGITKTANPKGLAYYFTDSPNSFINITTTFNQKILSLYEHRSQFLAQDNGVALIDNIVRLQKFNGIRYGLRKLCKYGESYRILSTSHLHCMPEASNF